MKLAKPHTSVISVSGAFLPFASFVSLLGSLVLELFVVCPAYILSARICQGSETRLPSSHCSAVAFRKSKVSWSTESLSEFPFYYQLLVHIDKKSISRMKPEKRKPLLGRTVGFHCFDGTCERKKGLFRLTVQRLQFIAAWPVAFCPGRAEGRGGSEGCGNLLTSWRPRREERQEVAGAHPFKGTPC